jgi:hypothetical protein
LLAIAELSDQWFFQWADNQLYAGSLGLTVKLIQ